MPSPEQISADELVRRYDGVLIDAYGVLVHTQGAFPGARQFIERLRDSGKPFCVITNDASRLPSSCAQKYRRDGVEIEDQQVITSASLIAPHLEEHGLSDGRVALLGPDEAREYIRQTNATLVDPARDEFDVLVICDESGYPFVSTIDEVLTQLLDRIDAGNPPEMLLPNPDLIYQRSQSAYGITSGAVAAMLEAILESRYPHRELKFRRLGKPHSRMFEQGVEYCGTDNVVVLGDQLETDIRGARSAGLDCALVATGLDHGALDWDSHELTPDFVVPGLEA
ncbi:MAG: HAD-IIA family hydrolase [Myxococcota bacterium]